MVGLGDTGREGRGMVHGGGGDGLFRSALDLFFLAMISGEVINMNGISGDVISGEGLVETGKQRGRVESDDVAIDVLADHGS